MTPDRALDLWSRALERLRTRCTDYAFSWIDRMRCDGATPDGQVLLAVPDLFFRDFIRDHFLADIEEELLTVSGQRIAVAFQPDESLKVRPAAPLPPAPGERRPAKGRLDDRFLFDTFVVAASNQLAWAGARAMADSPAQAAFNPLFIYGGTGLGKTHLLHAIGNAILERGPKTRVVYLSSEDFTNEFIGSLRDHKMPDFRRRYREDCEVLLIDDIQSLARKEQTQEEFFHTFNALISARRPVAITADVPPAEIEGLENRLKSRFQSGLTTDIQEPDFETRVAIVKKKAEALSAYFPDAVAHFIASRVQGSIRALEGALTRLWAMHSLTGQKITEELAARVLRDVLPQTRTIDVEQVQKECARFFRVSIEELRSARRHKKLAYARQVAMYLARSMTGASYPEIGRQFHRDHSTVMTAFRKVEAAHAAADPAIRRELEELTARLTR